MGISSLRKHPPQISISFSLSSLKHVMCLGVKKIFEIRKVSEKVLYYFEIFMIFPYATVGLFWRSCFNV